MEKILYIKRDTSDREGNALISKQGKPYTRMTLKVESKGERYISGFGNQSNADWAMGDEVDIVIAESATKDKTGKPYLNFSQPKKNEYPTDEKLETVLNKLVGIQLSIDLILAAVKPSQKKVEPTEEDEQDYTDGQEDSGIPF